jgi:hypothetical protein
MQHQHCFLATATSGGGDYEPLLVPITFRTGSANGAELCAPVTVNSDNLVETEEHFTVVLELVTSGTSLSLGGNTTSMTLVDSDGNNYVAFILTITVLYNV